MSVGGADATGMAGLGRGGGRRGGSSGLHDATAPYRLGLSFCTRNDFEMKPVSLVCDVLLLKASRLSLMYVK